MKRKFYLLVRIIKFVENVKTELFPEEIYVFTPDGRIVELPMGATAVDFAYAVHTDVGDTCVGARVNRKPYPLSKALDTGQTVEVITSSGAHPNATSAQLAVGCLITQLHQLIH